MLTSRTNRWVKLRDASISVIALFPVAVDAGVSEAHCAAKPWEVIPAPNAVVATRAVRTPEVSKGGTSQAEKDRRGSALSRRAAKTETVIPASDIESQGERTSDAAAFLSTQDEEHAMSALERQIGPDWHVVEDYIKQATYGQSVGDRFTVPSPNNRPEPRPLPAIVRATAAASAILNGARDHPNAREAAEFLIEHSAPTPNPHFQDFLRYPLKGAEETGAPFPTVRPVADADAATPSQTGRLSRWPVQ